MSATRVVRLLHRPSGRVLAEGPSGWGISHFEGNYYIRKRYLGAGVRIRPSALPGLCPYKGLFQWLHVDPGEGQLLPRLGWLYWLPNPLLPFIWFRVALPGQHPDIVVESLPVD